MQTLSTIIILATALVVVPTNDASAQAKKTKVYSVTFEKVVDNCEDKSLSLGKSSISIVESGKQLSVSVPNVPLLKGDVGRRGKLLAKAQANKPNGQRAQYGMSGRINGSKLQAIFMVEYFKGATPICTQSWNVSGTSAK